MTANPHRGEIAVDLGGVPRVLRPDFTALSRIESQTGQTIQQLTAQAIICAVSLTDMSTILCCGLVAAGEDVTADAVGQWMLDAGGAVEFYKPVGTFLIFGLTGGRDPDAEDQEGDDTGEPMPERAIRSGRWQRWRVGVWAGLKRAFGNQPRTN